MGQDIDLIDMNENELLVEIGKALAADSLAYSPESLEEFRQIGLQYIERNHHMFKQLVCQNQIVQVLIENEIIAVLVATVAALIEPITIHDAVAPIAMLLIKRDLIALCQET